MAAAQRQLHNHSQNTKGMDGKPEAEMNDLVVNLASVIVNHARCFVPKFHFRLLDSQVTRPIHTPMLSVLLFPACEARSYPT